MSSVVLENSDVNVKPVCIQLDKLEAFMSQADNDASVFAALDKFITEPDLELSNYHKASILIIFQHLLNFMPQGKDPAVLDSAWLKEQAIMTFEDAVFDMKTSLDEADFLAYGGYAGLLGGPLDKKKDYPAHLRDQQYPPPGFKKIQVGNEAFSVPAEAIRSKEEAEKYVELEAVADRLAVFYARLRRNEDFATLKGMGKTSTLTSAELSRTLAR